MIRLLSIEDLEQLEVLEQKCFSDPWSMELLAELLHNPLDFVWVYEMENGVISGYCNFRVIAGEGELMRIAVLPENQGQGISKKLMDALAAFARKQGIKEVTLEVRSANEKAVSLYKTYGFLVEAVRKDYYENPREDAFIMWNHCI